jgi:hypothetical protein
MSEPDAGVPGPGSSTTDDDGGMYAVFGEGKPRHIVGDSDEPPRRRPRRKPAPDAREGG